ncbi:MAG TPA: ABC transporter permease [Burkholderiales bacterium]|nr:ABC transporter permease [Burkholderiales bacterium]
MNNRIAAIARYTVLEALRTRLALTVLVVAVLVLAASFFVREIAVTESLRFQTAFYAATMRFAMVFLAALYVIASIGREFQDKGLDMVVALDLPRGHYALGKLAGYLVVATALAAAAGVPLLFLTGSESVFQWTASLAIELAVIVALALFCAITFNQLMPAASFVLAFYLLARALAAARLIAANPIAGAESLTHRVIAGILDALALVIPPIDQWTRTSWLVDDAGAWSALAVIVAQGAICTLIFGAAAVFDLYRKNF